MSGSVLIPDPDPLSQLHSLGFRVWSPLMDQHNSGFWSMSAGCFLFPGGFLLGMSHKDPPYSA